MTGSKVLLGDVCNITMGQAPSGESYNTAHLGTALIAGAGDFGDVTPEPSKYTSAPTKLSKPNDVILCIRATIGDRNWSDKQYCLGRGVAGLRGNEGTLDQSFLWHWIGYITPRLKAKGRGATFLQVSKADIASLEIDLPSLAEQRRIAAILDSCEAMRIQRHAAIAKLEQLLHSVYVETFGDPLSNPRQWGSSTIGAECEVGSGSTPSRQTETYFSGSIPWVKSTEVNWGVIEATGEHVSASGQKAARLKLFPTNTVVVALYGQGTTRGKCALLGMPATMNQACAGIWPGPRINAIYLFHYLKHSYSRLRSESRGGNQENLNLGIIKSYPVPIPPLDVQNHFARISSVCDANLRLLDLGLTRLDELFDSLRSQAFAGKL